MPGQGKSLLVSENGVTVITLPLNSYESLFSVLLSVSCKENKKTNTRKPKAEASCLQILAGLQISTA